MYDYDRTAATVPGAYDKQMQRLVKVVDSVMGGVKYVARTKRMLDDIANTASQDDELDSNMKYGIQQYVDEAKKALDMSVKASDDLGFAYDELNKQLLRLKRR